MLKILLANLICLPAAALCYLPVRDRLKNKSMRTFAAILAGLFAMIGIMSYLTWKYQLRSNDLLPAVFPLCFLIYHFSLKLPLRKTLGVFSVVVALLSILTNYAACFDAFINPSSGLGTYTLQFSLFQLGITVLAAYLLGSPFIKYGKFLVDQQISPLVWYALILFSAVTACSNIALYPLTYLLFHEEMMTFNILLIISEQLLIGTLMLIILSSSISSTLTISKMKERDRIYEMQESQFQSQQKYIKASEKTRHDFRHSIMTMSELYHAGNMEALGEYLDQYAEVMPKNEIQLYCGNNALNALLNYFVHVTKLNGIRFSLRVSVDDELPVSDVDLCSMTGNILENAVTACQTAQEKEIQLTILTEDHTQLYIVAVNTFNGTIRKKDGEYISLRHSRDGIGLSSIASTAESYGGIAQFSHEGTRFFSNVAIPLRRDTEKQTS